MKVFFSLTAILSLVISAAGQSGPYKPVNVAVQSSLPRHTVYSPGGSPGALPVLVWGNGACSADGTSVRGFLSEIASHGYLVISQGVPGGSGSSTVQMMRDAVAWAANGANGAFNVDRSKIMTAGFSCGGTEAYDFVNDNRVSSIGIFNSGLLSNYDLANTIRKPIMFALGGPSDIAYQNGERDYGRIPSGTPAWKGNIDRVGHGGTYYETNGGLFAKAAVNWLNWRFKGQASGKTYLQSQAAGDGWSNVVHKSLDSGSSQDPPEDDTPPTGCSVAIYGQCGGNSYSGCKTCASGASCKVMNEWYSQCL
jgi:dienelactone hydrolase